MNNDDQNKSLSDSCVVNYSDSDQTSILGDYINFESLLCDTAEIVILLDIHGYITYINNNGCDLMGSTKQELIGKNWFENFIPIAIRAETLAYYQSLIDNKNGSHALDMLIYENIIITKDNSHLTIRWHNTILRDNDNNVCGTFSIGDDITIQTQTTSLLMARENLRIYSETHSLNELLQQLLDVSESITQSTIGFFHFVDADQKNLVLQTWSTNTMNNMCSINSQGMHYSVDKAGVWGEALLLRTPIIHNDYSSLPNKKGLPQGHAPVIRELVVPIFEGETIVALIGVGNKPNNYTHYDQALIQELSALVWMIISKKKVEQVLEKTNRQLQASLLREKLLSQHDELTGIFSRRHLLELIQHELMSSNRYEQPFVVILFDLDDFKRINDQYGHAAGDLVLKTLCNSVSEELRSCDVFGRLGGEEFVILLPHCDTTEALILCERLRKKIETLQIRYEQNQLNVTISIGLTQYTCTTNKPTTVEKLIHSADSALYKAKSKGKNCIHSFE